MKIAVTGAHRTGKTSLVEKLIEALPEYSCKAEAYYELEDKGYFFSEIPSLEDYILQLEYSIEQLTASGDNIIFDRCQSICWHISALIRTLRILIFN